jgi:hypothetical protein
MPKRVDGYFENLGNNKVESGYFLTNKEWTEMNIANVNRQDQIERLEISFRQQFEKSKRLESQIESMKILSDEYAEYRIDLQETKDLKAILTIMPILDKLEYSDIQRVLKYLTDKYNTRE